MGGFTRYHRGGSICQPIGQGASDPSLASISMQLDRLKPFVALLIALALSSCANAGIIGLGGCQFDEAPSPADSSDLISIHPEEISPAVFCRAGDNRGMSAINANQGSPTSWMMISVQQRRLSDAVFLGRIYASGRPMICSPFLLSILKIPIRLDS